MPWINKEDIAEAKKIDLLTYLRWNEPDELVKISANEYCTLSHDSLRISHGMWHWFSRNIGGKTALDYLIKVKGMSFVGAVNLLLGRNENAEFVLPSAADNNKQVIEYLMSRGINRKVIQDCIDKKMIYENYPYHSAVFVGFDETNHPAYAMYRSIRGRILGEVPGSNKAYGFNISKVHNTSLRLFESAIDLLSLASMKADRGEDYENENYLSLGGVASGRQVPVALKRYLGIYPNISHIIIHFDSDEVGQNAAKKIYEQLHMYYIVDIVPPFEKDVNEDLMSMKEDERNGNNDYPF